MLKLVEKGLTDIGKGYIYIYTYIHTLKASREKTSTKNATFNTFIIEYWE